MEEKTINANKIFLAYKDNVKIYYIITKNIREIRKVYDILQEDNFEECLLGQNKEVSGNYILKECKKTSYVKIISRVKNTIIYGETDFENKIRIKLSLFNLGYGK